MTVVCSSVFMVSLFVFECDGEVGAEISILLVGVENLDDESLSVSIVIE